MALEEPHIQKIPISFLSHVDTSVSADEFTRVGIVDLIHEKGQPYLSFIHKSFQEFLAAQFVNEHNEYLQKILQHIWAPKWREVIKFLAGLEGEKVIKEVYAQKDNIIHAKLFLCAECLSETRNVCKNIRENIISDLKKIAYIEPFWFIAIEMLGSLGEVDYLTHLLTDKNLFIREMAAITLTRIGYGVDASDILKIVDLLGDEKHHVRNTAINALAEFKDIIDNDTI